MKQSTVLISKALPGLWRERGGLDGLIRLDAPAVAPGMVVVAKQGEDWQEGSEFLAATYNGSDFTFDLFDLRAMDVEISDDMLICLDALRWGKADLYLLVPDGDSRMKTMIVQWGLRFTST